MNRSLSYFFIYLLGYSVTQPLSNSSTQRNTTFEGFMAAAHLKRRVPSAR